MRSSWRQRIMVGALTGLVLAACGADGDTSPGTSSPPTPASTSIAPPTTVAPDGGWIGREPAWASGESSTRSPAGAALDLEAPAEAASDVAGTFAPDVPDAPMGPLRAGSVDDNDDFDRFLAYLDRIRSAGIPLRTFDPSGRVVVRVVGSSGLPVAGAEVTVTAAGAEVARLRTTADGSTRFHPLAHGVDAAIDELGFTAGDASATAVPGGTVALTVSDPGGVEPPAALDVLFLLDATGSMGDEIGQLKVSIDSIAERVDQLEAAPDVRFAMTLYRDLGDAFVTATHDFTSDVDAFRAALADVQADGGGDYPEALDEGLAEALALPAWRDPATTVQLVFLVADAPPQIGRQVEVPYPDSIREAIARGVKIFPVASSESDDQAEAVFRQLAQATGARFVFLAYGAAGAATGASTDIDRTDYEELALDDLIVRLIAEELAALNGDPSQVPPPTPTTTTNPPGQ